MALISRTIFAMLMIGICVAQSYVPFISDPTFMIPANNLPPGVTPQLSNNCVAITIFQGLLFIGWRTAPDHFASSETVHYIMSSSDMGGNWTLENKIYMGTDMREPFFIEMDGQLIYSFFQAGTDPVAFQPQFLFRTFRTGPQEWSTPEVWGHPGEIAWQLGVVNGTAYASSYSGNHYDPEDSNIDLFFNYSTDGKNWFPVNPDIPVLYNGGISELGWAFDDEGNFYAVGRNEDGDSTGFGSHTFFAPAGHLGEWQVFPTPQKSNPWIYESPRMFSHNNEMYLIARRDINGPYDRNHTELPFSMQKIINLSEYSLRAHTTSLYQIDKKTMEVIWLMDLPGDGDTAFPSIIRLGPHKFLIANYTSPLDHPDWSWIHGQISDEGTQIYFIELEFMPAEAISVISK